MPEKAVVDQQSTNIDSILLEQRKFECAPEFSKHAHVKSLAEYERLYKESIDDPDKFWARIAGELYWFKKWDRVLEWDCPWAK
jgi:acetyl-CoA synthetase